MQGKTQVIHLNALNDSKELVTSNEKFKCLHYNFEVGEGLKKHRHNGYAIVFVLKGTIKMTFETEHIPLADEDIFELSEHMLLSFDARLVHDLVAMTKAQVLVTISESLS
ncbi:MAG: cupin domain-containing protein [Turicibacter sp.]|nr:cupin domain-containing protein [Turicibacter sp.]